MNPSLTLSRGRLETFLACQRQFQLRYLDQLPWPHPPHSTAAAAAFERGQRFHQLVERHYLRLPVPDHALQEADPQVRQWWQTFLHHAPTFGDNVRLLTETTLTVTLGNHQLLGRFDFVALTPDAIHIYDWKTGQPRLAADLQNDWQSRLYLGLAYEGAAAFALPDITPEQISLTYWYVREPLASQTLTYSAAAHEANWGNITRIVSAIDRQLPTALSQPWPLTDDLTECARCPYQNFCGRFAAAAIAERLLEEREDYPQNAVPLEPDLP